MLEQVQIKAIDMAWEWVKKCETTDLPMAPEPMIRELAKLFDQAYKAVVRTLTPE